MNEIPKWAWGCVVIAVIYFLASHPVLLGTLLAWGVVVAAAVFFLGGFAFYLNYNDMQPPLVVLIVFVILCCIFPSLLGVVFALGLVGGTTFLTLAAMGYFGD